MAKIKKAQSGYTFLGKLAAAAKKRLDNYSGTELSAEQKKSYTEMINKKAAQAEADRAAKPRGYKSGGKIKTAQTGTKKPASDTTRKDTVMSPAMKAYYENLIKKKASDAEADRKAKPKGYKSGGKVVKKAAKAKYGVKKSAKKK